MHRPLGKLQVRWWRRRDLFALAAIRAKACGQRVSEQIIDRHRYKLWRTVTRKGQITVLKVLCLGKQVVGYMIYRMYDESCSIIEFNIDRRYQNLGLGTFLINTLIGPESPVRRDRFRVRLGVWQIPGRCFLEKLGFEDRHDPQRERDDDMVYIYHKPALVRR